jgi:ABC-type multidrug transport system fused ATPase/permease subunit
MKVVVDNVFGDAPVSPVVRATLAPLTAVVRSAGGPRERLLAAVVVLGLVLQGAHQLVLMLHSRLSARAGHHMVRDLREQLFAHVQALTLAQHAKTPMGDALYRLESDACCLEHLVLRGLFPIVFSALTLVAMFVVLVRIDVTLTMISLLVVPALFAWLKFYTRRMQPSARRAKELESAMVQQMHESVGAIRLVKSYAREDYEQERFATALGRALVARIDTANQESLFAAVVTMLTIAGTSLVILVGGFAVLHGRLSLGTLLLLIAYLGFVYGPLCGIANTAGALQQAVASAKRVRETFGLAVEPEDAPDAVDAPRFAGDVVFEDVSFAYDGGRQVLEHVSFAVRAGETVALVGPSGVGKTTIMSLLTRLYDVSGGRILIDGRDIRSFRLKSLRQRVGVVLQEAVAVAGTIRENLQYGRLGAEDAEIEHAATAANAHGFIMRLPRGYDTALGDGGSGLSGGQKQRLSLARAFLKDAPILILDEPTAALDTISEEQVFEGVRRLQDGRTTFVIAHRLSTVRSADRILVLDAGRVVADGTHEQLLASCDRYARLASQLVTPPHEEQTGAAFDLPVAI